MMTQYEDRVIKRAKEIAAEEWAKGVEHIHSHRLNSMWYEPEPNKVKHKNVLDITYNDGRIERDGVVTSLWRLFGACANNWACSS